MSLLSLILDFNEEFIDENVDKNAHFQSHNFPVAFIHSSKLVQETMAAGNRAKFSIKSYSVEVSVRVLLAIVSIFPGIICPVMPPRFMPVFIIFGEAPIIPVEGPIKSPMSGICYGKTPIGMPIIEGEGR